MVSIEKNKLYEVFHQNTVGQMVAQNRDLIQCSPGTTVQECLATMQKNGIHSVPLIDASGAFNGWIGLPEIILFLNDKVEGKHISDSTLKTTLQEVCALRSESKKLCVYDSCERVDQLLKDFSHGERRGLVKGKGWTKVVTERDVARFLFENMSKLESLGKASIKALELTLDKKLISVNPKCSVMDAVHTLAQGDLDAVPVITDGQIVATFSSSDLCDINQRDLASLLKLNVMEFLLKINSPKVEVSKGVCSSGSKLSEVLEKLLKFEFDRLWVTQEIIQTKAGSKQENTFVGVVSIGDIIARLATYIE